MFARFFPHGYRKSTPDAVTLSGTLAPSVTLVPCGCEPRGRGSLRRGGRGPRSAYPFQQENSRNVTGNAQNRAANYSAAVIANRIG